MNETPQRPLNVPPPERPMEPAPEGWERFWVPFTLILVVLLTAGTWAIMRTGDAWVECQTRYIQATTEADSAAVDTVRVGPDGEQTCGGIRLQRT